MTSTSNLLSASAWKQKFSKKKSCTNCRSRKIRCDRAKPACESCANSESFKDSCEYDEDGSATRLQQLQRQNNILNERLQRYEHTYGTSIDSIPFANAPTPINDSMHDNVYDIQTPTSTTSSDGLFMFNHIQYKNFTNYSSNLGFFLDPKHLESILWLDNNYSDQISTETADLSLIYAIQLWIVHLSSAADESSERELLIRATQNMSVVLRDDSINPQDHALKILHLIQAHILLAQYLFRTGSVLEGKYYVQGALSLVLGAGFYPEAGHTGQKSVEISELHEIAGPQERIGAFWTSFTLQNLWAIATASSSLLRGDSRCMKDSAGLFFNGHDSSLAKAVYLWDRTTRFDDQHYDDSSSSHFFDLDNMIHQRIQESSFSVSPENVHVQTLLHLAMIDLHKPFPHDPVSNNKIMASLALAIRLAIDQNTVEWRVFDPILPVLWRKIAEILVRQIKLHHQESLTRVILNDARVNEYIDSIIGILSLLRTMEELSIHSGLMGLEANRVRSLYELELKGLLDITP